MEFVADLHLHSKYSRAVSQDMILPTMAMWAKKKGIDILTTGDWTHPLWLREIKSQLEEAGEGVYKISKAFLRQTTDVKNQILNSKNTDQKSKIEKEPVFLLTVEVSSIYSQGGKLRRIHNLIFAPSFETVEKINKELARRGVNLMSDGRPMMGLPSKSLLELILTIDKRAMLIPCHAWTPWFSLYGSNSGFDSIEECFGEYSKYIYAIETGLSSDPAMNWKIAELENRSILSFSDAHSPAKMGREATVFKTGDELGVISYEMIRKAITMNSQPITHNVPRIAYTIEFYPEEGKYHYTGHRNCKVVQSPEETAKNGTKCPVCGRTLTVGVEHRVQELAKGEISNFQFPISNDKYEVKWISDPTGKHPPYVSLVPLLEILAEALNSTTASQRVKDLFDQLSVSLGTEFTILLRTPIDEIAKRAGGRVAEGIKKVREREIVVIPGYDGEYGVVKIWQHGKDVGKDVDEDVKSKNAQLGLF